MKLEQGAKRSNLRVTRKRVTKRPGDWSHEDEQILLDNWGKVHRDVLADMLHRTVKTVYVKAAHMGLRVRPNKLLYLSTNETNIGVYEADESQMLKAINDFRTKHRRVPTLQEGFRIAWELGWRRA